ncbi:MAG: multidrug effflux MFS transporter [Oceanospirillaceae bacterium]
MNAVRNMRETEFVALMALMMSLVALSIDAILPALPNIAQQLEVSAGNGIQQVVAVLFLGLTIGQLFYGPLSDQLGRKPAIMWGTAVYIIGSLICAMADDFTLLLLGRFLQGFGVAAMRVLSFALVRDLYSGAAMARIMSLAMSVFILVPCLAPLLGQSILAVADWRSIFWVLVLFSLCLILWFWLRQKETLSIEKRVPMNLSTVYAGWRETCTNPITVRYILAAGLIQGGFTAYLLSAQQIFDLKYQTGDLFALYFAILALAIGAASLLNARIVRQVGMSKICAIAAALSIGASGVGLLFELTGLLSFVGFMLVQGVILFTAGLMLGNMNAIAMQPVGHIAGVASSIISFISGSLSLAVGVLIGSSFDLSVAPLFAGVLFCSIGALTLVRYKGKPAYSEQGY